MFKAWLKKYWKNIVIILCCLIAIGGVITGAILGRNHTNDNADPPAASQPEQDENESATPPIQDDGESTEKVYTLMDLGSKGCTACDNLQPVLANLRSEYEGKINVLFYDIARTAEGRNLANQYNVKWMPTLIFLDENGEEVERIIGFQSEEQLKNVFRDLEWIE